MSSEVKRDDYFGCAFSVPSYGYGSRVVEYDSVRGRTIEYERPAPVYSYNSRVMNYDGKSRVIDYASPTWRADVRMPPPEKEQDPSFGSAFPAGPFGYTRYSQISKFSEYDEATNSFVSTEGKDGPFMNSWSSGPVVLEQLPYDASDKEVVRVYNAPPEFGSIIQKEVGRVNRTGEFVVVSADRQVDHFGKESWDLVLKPIGVGVASPFAGLAALMAGCTMGIVSVCRGCLGACDMTINWIVKPLADTMDSAFNRVDKTAEAQTGWGTGHILPAHLHEDLRRQSRQRAVEDARYGRFEVRPETTYVPAILDGDRPIKEKRAYVPAIVGDERPVTYTVERQMSYSARRFSEPRPIWSPQIETLPSVRTPGVQIVEINESLPRLIPTEPVRMLDAAPKPASPRSRVFVEPRTLAPRSVPFESSSYPRPVEIVTRAPTY